MRNISVGIDLGTATTRVVVGEFLKGEKYPKIIGLGESETKGMRHGYITSPKETLSSLKVALEMAEKSSGARIKKAFVSIGGATLRGEISGSSVVISKADGEVTSLDVNKAVEECEANTNLGNKKVLHVFPVYFRLDGKEVLGRPEGMKGNKLEVKSLIVTCSNLHFEELYSTMEEAGVTPIDVIASPIAGAKIALSKRQKIVGGGLVDIGAETTSLVIYENDIPVSLRTFSIGSNDVTNDIALGMKVTLEEAEGLKLGSVDQNQSKKKLDEIIDARFSDIFELIENHLKKIKRSELLPAGMVFIGGGANTGKLEEMSKNSLKLPSKIGSTTMFGNTKTKLRDPRWFVALGLLSPGGEADSYGDSSLLSIIRDIKNGIKTGIKQLKP
jgi:cell division protein FtsA